MTKRFLTIVFIAACTLGLAPAPAPNADALAYTHPQQLVDIGGRRLNLYCVGHGSPTVVFEAGISDWSSKFALVQPAIARTTRACSYDRAGMGYSDARPASQPSTSAHIVDDLHALLRTANIAPPYVLVGHSFGGFTVRLFADRYPSEVVGMVLIDPTPEDALARFDALTNGMYSKQVAQGVESYRKCAEAASKRPLVVGTPLFARCTDPVRTELPASVTAARQAIEVTAKYQRAQYAEFEDFFAVSALQVERARRSYGTMPLIVLTRTIPKDRLWPALDAAHDQMAALSSAGVNLRVPNTHHNIQLEQPGAVIQAVERVLRSAANRSQSEI